MKDNFLRPAQHHWCRAVVATGFCTCSSSVFPPTVCTIWLSKNERADDMEVKVGITGQGEGKGRLQWSFRLNTVWRWWSGGVWERFQGIFNLSDSCHRLLLYCFVPTHPPSLLFPTGEKQSRWEVCHPHPHHLLCFFPRSPCWTMHCGMWIFAALLPFPLHIFHRSYLCICTSTR